jgi:hypothetical protein
MPGGDKLDQHWTTEQQAGDFCDPHPLPVELQDLAALFLQVTDLVCESLGGITPDAGTSGK